VIQFSPQGRTIVASLRAMLESAERGELTCLIAVGGMSNGDVGGAFCGGDGVLAVLGELRIIEARAVEFIKALNQGRL